MGNNNAIIKFLEEEYWKGEGANNKTKEIKIIPLSFRKTVYGFNIYFPAMSYKRKWENYEAIVDLVLHASHYSAWVNTTHGDYNHGFISIILNLSHEEYSDEIAINMLKSLTKTIATSRISPPACT